MTTANVRERASDVATPAGAAGAARPVRKRRASKLEGGRGYVSAQDWRNPRVSVTIKVLHTILLALLIIAGIGPMLLLAKFAITPTQDIIRSPLAVFPHGVRWQNISEAWNDVQISRYFLNTIWLAAVAWRPKRSARCRSNSWAP